MTTTIRITVKFPYTTNIPRDCSENVFHFMSENDDIAFDMFTFWTDKLTVFYNTPWGTGPDLAAYMGRAINHPFCKFIGATLDPVTGTTSPTTELNWELDGPGGVNPDLPFEVALCGSYNVDRIAHPGAAGRRRGRIYLGPLTTLATAGTGADSRAYPNPSDAVRDGLATAMQKLAESSADETIPTAIGPYGEWVLWSRADGAVYPITYGYVDNEWDTQRRRGQEPTDRQVWEKGL